MNKIKYFKEWLIDWGIFIVVFCIIGMVQDIICRILHKKSWLQMMDEYECFNDR